MLTAVKLNIIKDVAHVLRPLEAMTREASAEHYITISKVVPMVSCAIDQYNEMRVISSTAGDLKINIALEIEKRFGQLEYNMLLAVSTLLDPRFKNLHFKKPDACAKAMSRIRKFILEYKSAASAATVSSTSSEDEDKGEFDFRKHHKSLAHTQIKRKKSDGDDELTLYLSAPVNTLKVKVLETWQEVQDAPPMLTSSEVGCLCEIIQLLQPFERLTKEICGQNYFTVSKVIPLVSCFRGMLEKYLPSFESTFSLKAEIEKEVSKRFDKLEQCSSLAIATALDPRFKLIHFKNAAAKGKVINYINNYLTNNLTNVANDSSDESEKGDNTEGDIWSYHKVLTHNNIKNKTKDKTKAETEFHMFMSSPVTPIKGNALEMWDDMKGLFPGLYILAMIYLPIVATSVPSERLFSEAGATITQERNRLLGTRLSKLLFLNSLLKK
ncbi:Zinc finger BED domain-containing protein 1 [Eumeta japonica]|uniref:Zinc finger BED domain-containing protein 1 n=1 Tax=Eumeta variegata TaxID=151549 RepID=A0A4C1VUT0_EUMVA|nr:Zinc finger BED domain-containing protein 1 [Eumeta japonica]